ncbi:MAG: hypothetical protein QG657_1989, partial [Acidobacteriota bacterium]|nr:hypothetical protein [Acidobacteriota bacterium]
GWIVGMFGIILKTKSSFESWEFVPTSINNNLHTCFFFDQVTGVVAGPVGIIMEIPNGNGLSEMFDKNPRVDFEHLDCVTIIEKSLGLTIWNHRSNYIDILYKIRYKGGQVSNQTRNHFFIQDWIPSNSWLVEDITTNIGGEDVKNLTKTIRRNTLHPLEKMDIPIKDMRYHTYYIPLSAVKKILQHVIHPMIIVFFGNHHWIFASHVVMIIPTLKVEKFLRHTSSYQKIVVDLPFLSYLTKAKNIIGIKFLDIN